MQLNNMEGSPVRRKVLKKDKESAWKRSILQNSSTKKTEPQVAENNPSLSPKMIGSQDSEVIIIPDDIKRMPIPFSSPILRSSGSSAETNQLWLKMRRRKLDQLSVEELSAFSDKADILLQTGCKFATIPATTSRPSTSTSNSPPVERSLEHSRAHITEYSRTHPSLLTPRVKETLNGLAVTNLTLKKVNDDNRQSQVIQNGILVSGEEHAIPVKKEVKSPYNSDHCLTSAVIYPKDSATLQDSNVVRYERNPMIYNSNPLNRSRPNSISLKKRLNCEAGGNSDSVIDDVISSNNVSVNDSEFDHQFTGLNIDTNSDNNNTQGKEREGFGSLIESLSFKLALQIEHLQASIAKKDERIAELEKITAEQLNNEFVFKLEKLKYEVNGKEKEIESISERKCETDTKLTELLSLMEERESNYITKEDCGTLVQDHISLLAEIGLLKEQLHKKNEINFLNDSKNCDRIEGMENEVENETVSNDKKRVEENKKIEMENIIISQSEEILSLRQEIQNLESLLLSQVPQPFGGDNSIIHRNNNDINNSDDDDDDDDNNNNNNNNGNNKILNKLDNNEMVTISYSIQDIDLLINKFPIGIDNKGDKLKLLSFIDSLMIASDTEKNNELIELKKLFDISVQENLELNKKLNKMNQTNNNNIDIIDKLEIEISDLKKSKVRNDEELAYVKEINKKFRNERASALMRDSIITVEEYVTWMEKENKRDLINLIEGEVKIEKEVEEEVVEVIEGEEEEGVRTEDEELKVVLTPRKGKRQKVDK